MPLASSKTLSNASMAVFGIWKASVPTLVSVSMLPASSNLAWSASLALAEASASVSLERYCSWMLVIPVQFASVVFKPTVSLPSSTMTSSIVGFVNKAVLLSIFASLSLAVKLVFPLTVVKAYAETL